MPAFVPPASQPPSFQFPPTFAGQPTASAEPSGPCHQAVQQLPACIPNITKQHTAAHSPWVSSVVSHAETGMRLYRIRHDCKYWNCVKLARESAESLLCTLDGAQTMSGGNEDTYYYQCKDPECPLFFRVTQCAPKRSLNKIWVVSQKKDGTGNSRSGCCNYAPAAKGSQPPGKHPAGLLTLL
jgi:hypothetical protein